MGISPPDEVNLPLCFGIAGVRSVPGGHGEHPFLVSEGGVMENPRPEKVAVVDEVREKLAGSDAAVLTEYRGLNVPQMAALRESLRESGGELKVYKNTLVRFAARDLGLEIEDLLEGPTAIAFAARTADRPGDA